MSELMLRVSGIAEESIVDGPGIRLVLFTQGCPHNCKGCHNPETHRYTGGYELSTEEIIKKIEENPLLDGITFSGGEPFEQAEKLEPLIRYVSEKGMDMVTYTGYTWEELQKGFEKRPSWKYLAANSKILIDGPFIEEKKSLLLVFRGSANQRLINGTESCKQGKPVYYDDEELLSWQY